MPPGMTKPAQAPTAAYNIEEWMRGLEEAASNGEVRNGDMGDGRLEQRSTHCQHAGWGSRWCRQQERPWFPRDPSGGSPSSRGGSPSQGSDQSSLQSTMTRVSRESNWTVSAGRGLRVKVNLTIFKDEKNQGCCNLLFVAERCSFFHHSHWDDQHLLSTFLIVARVPGRPGWEFRWGCYPEWHPPDVGWALWHSNDIWCP